MKKRTIAYLLTVLILSQSCAVYQKTSVPLESAVDKGKVKVIGDKKTRKYDNIILKGAMYYGVSSIETHPGNIIEINQPIDTTTTSEIYLTKNLVYRVWVRQNNRTKNFKGVLYDVKDSTIVVASLLKLEDYKTQPFKTNEFSIKDIEKIKVRRVNKIGRSAGIGAGIGAVGGFTLSLVAFQEGSLFSREAEALIVASLLGGLMGIIGALVGTIKHKIIIDGSMENYNKNKYQLKRYSIIR